MMIAIAIVAAVLLSRTTFGRYVYATGGNAEAARLGGVRINTVRVATYALSGMAAALAGTLDASRVLSAQASGGGLPDLHGADRDHRRRDEHPGRRGLGPRTVVGCLFVALVANGFNLLGSTRTTSRSRWASSSSSRSGRTPGPVGSARLTGEHWSTPVSRIDWSFADTPLPASATSSGLARQVLVGPAQGAVHTELAAGAFAPGGWLRATPTPSRRPCTCSRASSSSTSAAPATGWSPATTR